MQKLQLNNVCDVVGDDVDGISTDSSGNANVNSVTRGRAASRGNRFQRRGSSYPSRRPQGRGGRNDRKCRGCQSTGHIVKDCPTRFCQACGQRGHDAWQQVCPNHQ